MDDIELRERQLANERERLANLERTCREYLEMLREDQRIQLNMQRRIFSEQIRQQRERVNRLEKELSV